ncbi:Allophanate hydrolase subunit 2 [Gordonia paraffinivorans]|uniref:Allophanate hydrolase subunit 2 n=1 Tax=Gordonia paraffinivorans TaxID=175628 RepID=A0ABD7V6B4_9ACTN|nr:allophanate hydrolase [Gordonia paraffinivorans]VFA89855.1 Allophanate hydrolase subunit 2 [Gordonia paraffinivorans]
MITIVDPGVRTTVQDLGRAGTMAMAMPPAGALDQFANRIANALVGNGPKAATLETALTGLTLTTDTDCTVAVTGADVDVLVDGVTHPTWTALWLPAGSELRIGEIRGGAHSYIAFAGGIDVPVVMGSRATDLRSGVGGLGGRALRSKDMLRIGQRTRAVEEGRHLPMRLRPALSASEEVRIVLGVGAHRLAPESLRALTEREFQVAAEADRMTCRFVGEPLRIVEPEDPEDTRRADEVPVAYPFGALCVADGSLSCRLRDAVPDRGALAVGTVITPDLDLLAQVKELDSVRFTAVDIDSALKLRTEHNDFVRSAIRAIA